MADVTIYRTNYCPYCDRAERLFKEMGVDFEEIDVTHDAEARDKLLERTGMRTVPQIFINGENVGGYDDVRALKSQGKLQKLIDGDGD